MAPKAAIAALDAAWPPEIPGYLREIYWWAYVHPNAVRLFERQWLVNLILFGNFVRLRDAALEALGERLPGRTLQIACVYGDFSARLAQRIEPGETLDIVDVLPIQLRNLRRKLPKSAPVRTFHCDSSALQLDSASYEQVVLFFLLHEQPEDVRRSTLREAIRVLKPGGKLVIVDYHLPRPLHPLRYLFPPVLRLLEPFALDLWRRPIDAWLPQGFRPASMTHETFFGELYQKIVITL
jgi:ubiquinone/menaquinone biosynthesis C-methylase UbiE